MTRARQGRRGRGVRGMLDGAMTALWRRGATEGALLLLAAAVASGVVFGAGVARASSNTSDGQTWIAKSDAGTVLQINPVTGRPVTEVDLGMPTGPKQVQQGGGVVLVTDPSTGRTVSFDIGRLLVAGARTDDPDTTKQLFRDGHAYIADLDTGIVRTVDPLSLRDQGQAYSAGSPLSDVVVDQTGTVWALRTDGTMQSLRWSDEARRFIDQGSTRVNGAGDGAKLVPHRQGVTMFAPGSGAIVQVGTGSDVAATVPGLKGTVLPAASSPQNLTAAVVPDSSLTVILSGSSVYAAHMSADGCEKPGRPAVFSGKVYVPCTGVGRTVVLGPTGRKAGPDIGDGGTSTPVLTQDDDALVIVTDGGDEAVTIDEQGNPHPVDLGGDGVPVVVAQTSDAAMTTTLGAHRAGSGAPTTSQTLSRTSGSTTSPRPTGPESPSVTPGGGTAQTAPVPASEAGSNAADHSVVTTSDRGWRENGESITEPAPSDTTGPSQEPPATASTASSTGSPPPPASDPPTSSPGRDDAPGTERPEESATATRTWPDGRSPVTTTHATDTGTSGATTQPCAGCARFRPPTDVHAAPGGPGRVVVSWSPPRPAPSGYLVQTTDGGALTTADGRHDHVVITGLLPGATLRFVVTADFGSTSLASAPSNVVTVASTTPSDPGEEPSSGAATTTAPTTSQPESSASEPSTSEPSEPKTSQPSEPSTSEPPPAQTSEPSEPETSEPSEPSTSEPSEPSTSEPSEPSTSEPSEPSTSEPSEPSTSEPSEPSTSEPSDPETSEPSEPSTSAPPKPPVSGLATSPGRFGSLDVAWSAPTERTPEHYHVVGTINGTSVTQTDDPTGTSTTLRFGIYSQPLEVTVTVTAVYPDGSSEAKTTHGTIISNCTGGPGGLRGNGAAFARPALPPCQDPPCQTYPSRPGQPGSPYCGMPAEFAPQDTTGVRIDDAVWVSTATASPTGHPDAGGAAVETTRGGRYAAAAGLAALAGLIRLGRYRMDRTGRESERESSRTSRRRGRRGPGEHR